MYTLFYIFALFSKFFVYASSEFSTNLYYFSIIILNEFSIVLETKYSVNDYLNFSLMKIFRLKSTQTLFNLLSNGSD